MNTNSFTDRFGSTWTINIKTKDVERVKDFVQTPDGKPVDLFAVTENGDYSSLYGGSQTIANVVAFLIIEQIAKAFDLKQYDDEHAALYAILPDEKQKIPLQKSLNWFSERIDGDTLIAMTDAFEVALLNFIPNRLMRTKLQQVVDQTKKKTSELIEKAVDATLRELQSTDLPE